MRPCPDLDARVDMNPLSLQVGVLIVGGAGSIKDFLRLDPRRVILAALIRDARGLLFPPFPVAFGAFSLGERVVSLGAPVFPNVALPATEGTGGDAVRMEHVPAIGVWGSMEQKTGVSTGKR